MGQSTQTGGEARLAAIIPTACLVLVTLGSVYVGMLLGRWAKEAGWEVPLWVPCALIAMGGVLGLCGWLSGSPRAQRAAAAVVRTGVKIKRQEVRNFCLHLFTLIGGSLSLVGIGAVVIACAARLELGDRALLESIHKMPADSNDIVSEAAYFRTGLILGLGVGSIIVFIMFMGLCQEFKYFKNLIRVPKKAVS